ncbi:MAG: DUF3179 domain-containing (seleno)protein, partial [Rhodospirillales bacterium]
RQRAPNGRVLMPNDPGFRPYGRNPYVGYDQGPPFLYRGDLPKGVPAMLRVVAVGSEAWALTLLRKNRTVRHGDLTIAWTKGQNSALDSARIEDGFDVGNIVVRRKTPSGEVDVPYDVTFAFAFYAFRKSATLHTVEGAIRWSRK